MPDITPNLSLKKPLGTEDVTRASYNENLDLLDANAAKATTLATHLADTAPHSAATNLVKTTGDWVMSGTLRTSKFTTGNVFETIGDMSLHADDAGAFSGSAIRFFIDNVEKSRITDTGLFVFGAGNGTTHGECTGSPEGVVTAIVGSTRYRLDGGASTTFYVKQSGTGNTGWVAK